MRQYRIGTPGDLDSIRVEQADTPKPGPGQVLVRMRAFSLNYRDLMVATGRYGGKPALGRVPLSDGAGEVVEAGPGTSRFKPGDRVASCFFPDWIGGDLQPEYRATALGGDVDGVLTEYRVAAEAGFVALPPGLSFAEGASLPCAAVTAWHALFGLAPLQPGQTVLILGTGGVSIFALQFAHSAGARVIGTSSSDTKLERAKQLGLDAGVNYRTHPDWEKQVLELTGGRGVDQVIEVGGAGTLPKSLTSSRIGGQVSLIGVLTGGQIDPLAILWRSAMVRGVYVGSRDMFEAMNRAITQHGIHPIVDREFGFDEVPAAFRHMQGASHFGKIVIQAP
jgi:NADPH:quinone reductase-like Zn-dependent oxidoreductase